MNAMKGLERPGYSVLSASDKGGSWPSRGDLRRGGGCSQDRTQADSNSVIKARKIQI